eukprot:g20801.t1
MTRGPDGATAYYRTPSGKFTSMSASPPCTSPKTIDFEGNPAPVADTVGAGDTCMGSLLCSFLGEVHSTECLVISSQPGGSDSNENRGCANRRTRKPLARMHGCGVHRLKVLVG